MRINNFEIEAKTYKNLSIDLEDEYSYMNFYKRKESDYNYIKRKYEPNYNKSGYYIGLYEDESIKRGYFYVVENMLLKDEHIYKKNTRYCELLEFGFTNNNLDQVNFLIDYLYYYVKHIGASFLKVKTKEKDFIKFYELLKKYKYTKYKNYIYIKIDKMKFESIRYLKKYKYDKISLKELYHLNEIGFVFSKTKGVLSLYNDECITINRKTRKITYPSFFKNLSKESKYNYLNYNSKALIHFVKSNLYEVYNENIELDYKVKDLEEYEFIKIGRRLLSLEKDKFIKDYQIKDNIKDFAKVVCNNDKITSMNVIMECDFRWKSYYASLSSIWIYLEKYLNEEKKIEEE